MSPAVDLSLERLFQHFDEGYCLAELVLEDGRAVDYRFLRVNPGFSRMTGLQNVVGRSARELVPGMEQKWIDRYATIARGTSPHRFEDASDALGRHLDVFATPIGDGVRFALVFRDVTERKRAELALRESEERFRTLADHMSQFAWMADSKGSIFWYNRRWYEYTGTTLEEMHGWGWTKVLHSDHVARVVARLQEAWDTGSIWEDTFPLLGADGQYRWFLSRAMPIRDDDGNVVRWLGTNTDITEQRHAEEQLRARTESLRLALRSADAGDWQYDFTSGELRPSVELLRLLGLTPEGAQSWISVVHGDDRERVQEELRNQLEGGESELSFEFRCEHPERGMRWMECIGSIERGADERASSCHGIVLDITVRKQREAQIQRVMAELNHRVKNTLAVVQSIARQTARRATDLGTFRRSFEDRLRSIARGNSLLTQSDWEGAALHAIVASELTTRAESDDQIVIDGVELQLPPNQAMAMHMIMHEWATNATKYGALRWSQGRVTVEWRVEEDTDRGPRLALTWREVSPREIDGSDRVGFGTQLVTQLVQHELGGVCERDIETYGFVYRLCVPLEVVEVATPAEADGDIGYMDSDLPKVLFAEDRAALAFGLRDELVEFGFQVIGPARTLTEARTLAARHAFDVALLDIDLGGESSLPLAEALLEAGKRVLLLSGFSARDLPDSVRAADLLSKPVDTEELLAKLDPVRFGDDSECGADAEPTDSSAPQSDAELDFGRIAHDVRNTFATLLLALGSLRRDAGADQETVAAVDDDVKLLYRQLLPLLERP